MKRITVLLTFIALCGCRSAAVPESPGAPAADAPAGEPEIIQIDPSKTIQIDPSEAADFARDVRADVRVSAGEGLTLSLWATEQLLEDPIAVDVTPGGEVYVTASSRSGGLLDIRGHPTWTTRALEMNTVADHERFLKEELAPQHSASNDWLPDMNGDGSHDWRDLAVKTERLYKIMDTSGDGVADRAHLLVDGFNTPVSDVLGGLLVHEDDIYLAAAPDLWMLEHTVGSVTNMKSISHGYGVHPGFFGHGMSGITVGPDGRIYWSVGDMGLHVTGADGRTWSYPHQGAILRAFPDGSGFEVFAAGLRNVHEFEFDEFGNLISVDNDGDHPGEKERIVYIVEGSDSGWRTNWQFGKYTDPDNNDYKVWMDENLFKPRFEGQAAYITPPIANYHAGPAGMAYNPGTALNESWKDYFFVSEYTGSPATTHVYAFRLKEQGAGFELVDEKVAASGVLSVGLDFGADGALYLADWIDGWDSKGAGRIWRLEASENDVDVQFATRNLLGDGFAERTIADLAPLLGYPDLRVRRKAQMELADRSAERALLDAAHQTANRLARMHGLWGLWQLALENAGEAERLVEFLGDGDAEVRAQAARILGDVHYTDAAESLLPLLHDQSARVRFFAAQALGQLEYVPAMDPIVAMLEENDGRDTYLRHAGALALARIGNRSALEALHRHSSAPVRIAAVVGLRRIGGAEVAAYLNDEDEAVVTEAARAINDDGGIRDAVPALAAILNETPFANEPLLRRVINANFLAGTPAAARRVATYAQRADAPTAMRVEALSVLGVWSDPSPLDRVDGAYRGVISRDPDIARDAIRPNLEAFLTDPTEEIRMAASGAIGRLQLAEAGHLLMDRLRVDTSPEVRGAALEALQALHSDSMEVAVRTALSDSASSVRMIAVRLIPSLDFPPALTAELLEDAVERGSTDEQQSALSALGDLDTPEAGAVLANQLELLETDAFPAEAELDLLLAAAAYDELEQRVEAFRSENSPSAGMLIGGSFESGQGIFYDHESAQCTRCHAVKGYGGDVGPDLTDIGSVLSRQQILEALVDPSARIAPGFGRGPSPMPPMDHILTKKELRDVVEFLATLK